VMKITNPLSHFSFPFSRCVGVEYGGCMGGVWVVFVRQRGHAARVCLVPVSRSSRTALCSRQSPSARRSRRDEDGVAGTAPSTTRRADRRAERGVRCVIAKQRYLCEGESSIVVPGIFFPCTSRTYIED